LETTGDSSRRTHSVVCSLTGVNCGEGAVVLGRTTLGGFPTRRLFEGSGRFQDLTWSPDGRWLLLGWRDADQWLFIPAGHGRVHAVSNISRQFDPGATGKAAFPRISGWCCAR
jgi:hypothetical protein